jgi:hypothetical protein
MFSGCGRGGRLRRRSGGVTTMDRGGGTLQGRNSHLEVAVDDVFGVEVVEDEHHLGRVEARHPLLQLPARAQVGEELPARHVLQHQVHARLVLEMTAHAHNKGVVELAQDVTLRHQVRHLLALEHVRLEQRLDGAPGAGGSVAGQADAPEAAGSQDLAHLKVVQRLRRQLERLHGTQRAAAQRLQCSCGSRDAVRLTSTSAEGGSGDSHFSSASAACT